MRIRWIRENRANLWKFRSRNESTIRIFKNRTRESVKSGFVTRYETNLSGVRIRDYDTKRIHVFTNLLYDSRILRIKLLKHYMYFYLVILYVRDCAVFSNTRNLDEIKKKHLLFVLILMSYTASARLQAIKLNG